MTTKKPTIKEKVMEILKENRPYYTIFSPEVWGRKKGEAPQLDYDELATQILNLFGGRLEGLLSFRRKTVKEWKELNKQNLIDEGYNQCVEEFYEKIDKLIEELNPK